MAQKDVGYNKIHIDKLSGGLADTGNPSVINSDESPCLYNVDFSQYGSVMSRDIGNYRMGLSDDDIDDFDSVLALTSFCICDKCDFFEDQTKLTGTITVVKDSATIQGAGTQFVNELNVGDTISILDELYTIQSITDLDTLILTSPYSGAGTAGLSFYLVPDSPRPADITILIRGVGVKGANITKLQWYSFATDLWYDFDTIQGKHVFDIVTANCRIYYSNGYEDLRYACFHPKARPDFPCEVEVEVGYPTCASEYGPDTQTTVIVDIVNEFIFFGDGRPGPDLTALMAHIAVPANVINVTVPNPDDPNNSTVTFQIEGPYTLTGSILYFDHINSPPDGVGGTFYENVTLAWAGPNQLIPTYCGGTGSNRLAEGIRGYMLTVFDNRLFISGDLKENQLDLVAYSRKAQQFSNETDVAIHLGDFDVVGFKHTISDSDRILFNNSCAYISAIVPQDGNLYVHRITEKGTEIYQMVLTSVSNTDGYYKPNIVNSSNAASWFKNITVTNGLQFYVTTFFGVPENKAFGLFPNFISLKSEDRSQKIRRTMEHLDFSEGAVAYFNRKIYYAARYKSSCNVEPDINDKCPELAEENLLEGKNDTLLVFDLDTSSYTIYKGFYVKVFLVMQNEFYYGSSIDGTVHRMVPNLLADNVAPNVKGNDIPAFFSMKRFNFNEPGIAKLLYRVYIEGYLGPGAKIVVGLILDCNKTVYNEISYDEIRKTADCFGLDCIGLDCEGCNGKHNSLHFKKHIEITGGNPLEFITLQPFIQSDQGFWQIDNVSLFVKAKADDDIQSISECGSLNTQNDNKCFS